MTLSDLQDRDRVFVDANIFIYHFTGLSEQCRDLLQACAGGSMTGYTSNSILAETCHRLMTIEAVSRGHVKGNSPAAQLQKKPDLVSKLYEYYQQLTIILNWNIRVLNDPDDIFIRSQVYRQRFGLLTNDSLIPVYMETEDIPFLATADRQFNDIPGVNVFSPADISL
jgi:predicted nucleic acid-binding protein